MINTIIATLRPVFMKTTGFCFFHRLGSSRCSPIGPLQRTHALKSVTSSTTFFRLECFCAHMQENTGLVDCPGASRALNVLFVAVGDAVPVLRWHWVTAHQKHWSHGGIIEASLILSITLHIIPLLIHPLPLICLLYSVALIGWAVKWNKSQTMISS